MSAFIMDSIIIETIVKQYGIENELDHETQQQHFFTLMNGNIKSVNFRYREKTRLWNARKCILSTKKVSFYSDIQNVKHLDCLEYQSCEIENYKKSKAYKLLIQYRDYFSTKIIYDLPAYDLADWG